MNSTQALTRARKLLGPKALIEVRKSVPVGDERIAEHTRRKDLTEKLKTLKEQRDARMNAVLKADAEFQRLKAEAAAVEKERDSLHGDWYRRVTIKTDQGYAYRIEAAGDNFEEALADLEAKRVKA